MYTCAARSYFVVKWLKRESKSNFNQEVMRDAIEAVLQQKTEELVHKGKELTLLVTLSSKSHLHLEKSVNQVSRL